MLTHIYIKNFAIVDTLEIDFTHGLSVLTGETGAGKSLWIDAINLALGQRADTSWIRPGADRSEISVTFTVDTLPRAMAWLKAHAFDEEGHECILRRIITRQGSSRSTINGSPVPLQRIREFAEHLIQIHGQHQQQLLFQPDRQRQTLDEFINNPSLLKSVRNVYKQWRLTHKEIKQLLDASHNKTQEIEFLQYQLDELDALSLKDGEWQHLSRQHQQLHNAKNLLEQLNHAIELTVENEPLCAAQLIQQALHRLNDIKLDDPQLASIRELLNTAAIHIDEAGNALEAYRNNVDLTCANPDEIEARLSLIYDVARKHHCSPENLQDVQHSLNSKLESLQHIDTQLGALTLLNAQLEETYQTLATKLTQQRQQAAQKLEKSVSQSMRKMDIQDAEFHVELQTLNEVPTPNGNEKITFLVQTNAGQGISPLQKIASGGEISRIILALYVLTASTEQTPTLVFDEVDVGISGKTAAIVGQLLRELGSKAQVLCITHLPQVAANGHHHYKVIKQSDGKVTKTFIEKLTEAQRVDEIARLLGGTKITKQSRLHASELLSLAEH